MNRPLIFACSVLALAACNPADTPNSNANSADSNALAAPAQELTLTRLDCGSMRIKNFDAFFSDRPGLYAAEPRDITDSCYLIRHGDQAMLWDTGLSADLKGRSFDTGDGVMRLDRTIAEQLAVLGLQPSDIDIVGISHSHGDHVGQAALFPSARLIIGAQDFELAQEPATPGGPNPLEPFTKAGAKVQKVTGDVDIFGDGSVVALHLPGHTPDHMALRVNLPDGPVLLSGDLYHAAEARQKRGVPPFNTDREKTLASMDRFEALAKDSGAKVVIQHEPAHNDLLPGVPATAR